MLKLYHSRRYYWLLRNACDDVLGFSIIVSPIKVTFSADQHVDLFQTHHSGDRRLQTAEVPVQSADRGAGGFVFSTSPWMTSSTTVSRHLLFFRCISAHQLPVVPSFKYFGDFHLCVLSSCNGCCSVSL